MAEEQEPSGPSLEPPSLFRRKKKPADPAVPVAAAPPPPPPRVDDSPTTILDDVAEESTRSLDAPASAPQPPRKAPRTGPLVPGPAAALLAGVLVGAVIVGLTSASFELCSRVQGTNSCGGPGFFLLVAILVVGVVLGAAVLRVCRAPEPGSTSFLAVGLTSVVALLFLIDALFEWWMIIVIPLVSAATYLLAHWVTATFIEPAKPVGLLDEPAVVDHDVR